MNLLDVNDLCSMLKVKKSWVYDEVQAGRLPAIRLGKQLRFKPAAIEEYLEQCAA